MKQSLTPQEKRACAARRLLNKRVGWRKDFEPHKEALRTLRDGGKMCDACKANGVSRQTLQRMLKKEAWPKKPGGPREGRWKIPPSLVPVLINRLRFFKQLGRPIGAAGVDWLRRYHKIIVAPAVIYSLRYRKKAKGRKKRMAAKAPARARIRGSFPTS